MYVLINRGVRFRKSKVVFDAELKFCMALNEGTWAHSICVLKHTHSVHRMDLSQVNVLSILRITRIEMKCIFRDLSCPVFCLEVKHYSFIHFIHSFFHVYLKFLSKEKLSLNSVSYDCLAITELVIVNDKITFYVSVFVTEKNDEFSMIKRKND